MKIDLLCYGITKEILGSKRVVFEFGDLSIGKLKIKLIEQYPKLVGLNALRFARGVEYLEEEDLVFENDEIVLIPPVSGG